MQIGIVFPQTEFGNDPAAIRDYAQTVAELGYTHVLAYDHVLGANTDRPGGWRGPYTYQTPFHEPFALFSYMAGCTERLGYITGILILPQRQTALVAKQAATLDMLCGGRFRLGVGTGWNKVEYDALGYDFHTRGKRLEEQVNLLRRLWTEELIVFDGEWDHIPDAGLNPLPVQQPIPIWFGGYADVVMRRVGRIGDGWLPGTRDPQQAVHSLEMIAEAAVVAGRSMDQIGIEARLNYGDLEADQWGARLEGWQQVGATHLSVNTMACGFTQPGEHISALRRFAEEVGL